MIRALGVVRMSRGLDRRVEIRIGKLFAASPNRALGIGEIADYAFELGGRAASRAQRLSTARAADRLLKRVIDEDQQRGSSGVPRGSAFL